MKTEGFVNCKIRNIVDMGNDTQYDITESITSVLMSPKQSCTVHCFPHYNVFNNKEFVMVVFTFSQLIHVFSCIVSKFR